LVVIERIGADPAHIVNTNEIMSSYKVRVWWMRKGEERGREREEKEKEKEKEEKEQLECLFLHSLLGD